METADDAHYEMLPEKRVQLTQILKKETKGIYLPNSEAGCAYYLKHHSCLELIILLEKHNLLNQEFHD